VAKKIGREEHDSACCIQALYDCVIQKAIIFVSAGLSLHCTSFPFNLSLNKVSGPLLHLPNIAR